MRQMRPLCTALFATCLALAAVAQPRFDFDRTPGRLDKGVRPEHHALTLELDPDAEHFDGEARITLRVRDAVPAILLHAHQLTGGRARLEDGAAARELRVEPDESTQTWRLVPVDGKPITAGEQRLHLAWRGSVQRFGAGGRGTERCSRCRPGRATRPRLAAPLCRAGLRGRA